MAAERDADTSEADTSDVREVSDAAKPQAILTPGRTLENPRSRRRGGSITISTECSINLTGTVSEGARAKISEVLQSYADELTKQLRTVEKESRDSRIKHAEFTASTAIKADEELRRNTSRAKGRRINILLGVISPISTGVVGTFSNYLHSGWQNAVFGAAVAIAFISTSVLVYRTAR